MSLGRGARVAVVAPGFAVKRDALEAGLEALRRRGFRPRVGRSVLEQQGYLAGDDDARAADLVEALVDPDVDAVWFARGGYGTTRLLERVPWRRVAARTRPLIGYSDLTALFAPATRRGVRCLYGPVVTELGDPATFHAASLRRALAGEAQRLTFRRDDVLVPGRARGPLLGGNLTVLTHLLGTRWALDAAGAILFLEDAGEPTYRVDRMLTQLEQAGTLRRIAGAVIGSLAIPPRRRFPPDRDPTEVLVERLGGLGVPVVRGLPAGHVGGKRTLPLGAPARLDTEARELRLGP